MATPALPSWITDARVPGYVAAHQLVPGETRLFGTESLYGDWGGEILLLAKDFGPTRIVGDRVDDGDPRPYRHDPAMSTNRRLLKLAAPFESRGLLYGSALANLLRDDGQLSGSLPNRREAMGYGTRVARFVVANMPRLRWIVCMGAEAWEVASGAIGVSGDWQELRRTCRTSGPLVAAYHPSARVSWDELRAPWEALHRGGRCQTGPD